MSLESKIGTPNRVKMIMVLRSSILIHCGIGIKSVINDFNSDFKIVGFDSSFKIIDSDSKITDSHSSSYWTEIEPFTNSNKFYPYLLVHIHSTIKIWRRPDRGQVPTRSQSVGRRVTVGGTRMAGDRHAGVGDHTRVYI